MSIYIDENYIVQTPCGPLQGKAGEPGVTEFLGIRYAVAKRFARPTPVTHWDGLYDARNFGAVCHQLGEFYPENYFYHHEFRENMTVPYSEDCLFLNIRVPNGAVNAPVVFFVHGGAFMSGFGYEKSMEPSAICRKGAIVVTINYRLGVFGFSNFEAARTNDTCGNYGLFDQLAAVQWVKDNIACFGGDPNHIVVMGQSAGAMSLQLMCLSPLSAGLISGAVLLSGGGLLAPIAPRPAEETFAQWNEFAASLGAHTLEELRALPAETLLRAHVELGREKAPQAAPVIDGEYVTTDPSVTARTDGAHPIPYILTATADDIFLPDLHYAATEWAALQNGQQAPPVYGGYFARHLPGDDKGAWHSSDLWYVFGSLHHSWRPMTDWDDRLSDAMIGYLVNFAATGNPNGEGLPIWLPLGEGQTKRMCFTDNDIAPGDVPAP